MEAHHLLYSYVLVWVIQGGYAAWVFYQWLRAGKHENQLHTNTEDEL